MKLFTEKYVYVLSELFDLDSRSSRYVLTDYMQSDLHKIIVSQQPLSSDHIKVFTYQILRGNYLSIICYLSAVHTKAETCILNKASRLLCRVPTGRGKLEKVRESHRK